MPQSGVNLTMLIPGEARCQYVPRASRLQISQSGCVLPLAAALKVAICPCARPSLQAPLRSRLHHDMRC
jgi:hypothetical protein